MQGGVKVINRDDGTHFLDHVYDTLLKPTVNPRNGDNNKPCEKRSGPDHL